MGSVRVGAPLIVRIVCVHLVANIFAFALHIPLPWLQEASVRFVVCLPKAVVHPTLYNL